MWRSLQGRRSSELAAVAAALVGPAAVAAIVAHGDVALTLLPDATRHLRGRKEDKRHERDGVHLQRFIPSLCGEEHRGPSAGKTHPLKF